MRVLVVTCAHRGDDARIVHRQVRILLDQGHAVTLIAPMPDDVSADPAGIERIDVPRAVGRRRVRAWVACRRHAAALAHDHDILLVHDPELVPVLARFRRTLPLVWDVHEDFVASASDRAWIPAPLRVIVRRVVGLLERWARGRCHVMLAEEAYAVRFPGAPIVPNSPWVNETPSPLGAGVPRIVYVGRLSRNRGAAELLELGRRLGERMQVDLVGDADPDVHGEVADAAAAGHVNWVGPLANPEALRLVEGAFAGVSLLRDHPNYVHSLPTKMLEYWAQGVPVVTTPLPIARALIEMSSGGQVVPYRDVDGCIAVLDEWIEQPVERQRAADAGHRYVSEHRSWQHHGRAFVELLRSWSSAS